MLHAGEEREGEEGLMEFQSKDGLKILLDVHSLLQ